MQTNLIGLTGYKKSGKDEVALMVRHLTSNWSKAELAKDDITQSIALAKTSTINSKWEIRKYAEKLKGMLCVLLDCTFADLESEDFKNQVFFGKTVRYMLQTIGTEWGRDLINPELWVEGLFMDWKHIGMTDGWFPTYNNPDNSGGDIAAEPIYPNWLISDVRFPNEVQAIHDRGGIVIRINRFENNTDPHPSEIHIPTLKVDYEIENKGTISELYTKVEKLYKTLNNAN